MTTKKQPKPDCSRGTACGYSCISKQKRCSDKLSLDAKQVALKLLSRVTVESKRSKGGGAGSATLTQAEVSLLVANEQFLRSATPEQIVARATERGLRELNEQGMDLTSEATRQQVADVMWELLPTKTKQHLRKKGSLASGNYLNPETGQHGAPNEPRAKFLLRRFIEQNGRDAYTGEPISLVGSDLEHIEPFGVYGTRAERADNMVFASVSVNQRKAEKTLAEFLDQQVLPVAAAASQDSNYWAKQSEAAAAAQSKKNAIDDLMAEKSQDSWTDSDIDALGSKYYYVGRALGHSLSYTKTRPRGQSGQPFSKEIGVPLARAFAAAYRIGDTARIEQLEAARQQLVTAANSESAVRKGNAGGKGGELDTEWQRLRQELRLS